MSADQFAGYVDLFNGIGRYARFETVQDDFHETMQRLTRFCAKRMGADYVLIATTTTDRIKIFGSYGCFIQDVSLSEGIRNRLSCGDEYIFIPKISDVPLLRNHKLFSNLHCLDGSLISAAPMPMGGEGRTGLTCLTCSNVSPPTEEDQSFLLNLANFAARFISAYQAAHLIEQQRAATWLNIDALGTAIDATAVGLAIFDKYAQLIEGNATFHGLTTAMGMPKIPQVHEEFRPFSPAGYDINWDVKKNNEKIEYLFLEKIIKDTFEKKQAIGPEYLYSIEPTTIQASENMHIKAISYPITDASRDVVYVGVLIYQNSVVSHYYNEKVSNKNEIIKHEARMDGEFISEFLSLTLRTTRRTFWRGNVEYSICRTWRAPMKKVQLAAVHMAKASLSFAVVKLAARQIAVLASKKFGSSIASVVAVPCGHSPDNSCMSQAIAHEVAKELKIPYVQAFPHSGLTEQSGRHKAKKVTAPDHLKETPISPALLVDDVATTGTHIEVYANALKSKGITTYSIAWIGPDKNP